MGEFRIRILGLLHFDHGFEYLLDDPQPLLMLNSSLLLFFRHTRLLLLLIFR